MLPILALAQAAYLDTILDDPVLRGAVVATCVMRADGTVLYQRSADQRMMPASNQKVGTCLFAASVLGLDYRPKTRFWRLADRVVITAEGDPSLTFAQLREVASRLGLPRRPLPVHLAQPYRPGYPPSWEYDDLPNRYAAPITAFSADRAAFEVWAEGGRLLQLPKELGLRVTTVAAPGSSRVEYDLFAARLTVSGTLPRAKTRLETLAQRDPDLVAARLFGSPVVRGAALPSEPPTLTLEGPPLVELIRTCLVESSNHYAENLLLIAAARLRPTLSVLKPYPEATDLLKQFLTETVGLEPGAIRADDGSGLSRHNWVTPRAMCRMLAWADGQPWGEALRSCLASPGKGTLRSRLAGSSFVGKTGTLDGVVALSGSLQVAPPPPLGEEGVGAWRAGAFRTGQHLLCARDLSPSPYPLPLAGETKGELRPAPPTRGEGVTISSPERLYLSLIVNHGIAPAAQQQEAVDRFVREVERLWTGVTAPRTSRTPARASNPAGAVR
ncbi:MAG TPA: D-alanyl-D-alanine carboxypeptidase/D-alanyl-D-alanine-endopeptidase [Fimbriimonadaceae bacterium]|nr:D-alanyl-D-alanine carboxypeptidase/D-alanyl-D-alanine-endopeptidase [Fimbriimonadaceae bacterium]HRJ95271.1 D-alanyl-D-alanine carboxypeptidase/D-alanyl-D-alanine-endopeptidase [Fimbriimonadaceae bacterium]